MREGGNGDSARRDQARRGSRDRCSAATGSAPPNEFLERDRRELRGVWREREDLRDRVEHARDRARSATASWRRSCARRSYRREVRRRAQGPGAARGRARPRRGPHGGPLDHRRTAAERERLWARRARPGAAAGARSTTVDESEHEAVGGAASRGSLARPRGSNLYWRGGGRRGSASASSRAPRRRGSWAGTATRGRSASVRAPERAAPTRRSSSCSPGRSRCREVTSRLVAGHNDAGQGRRARRLSAGRDRPPPGCGRSERTRMTHVADRPASASCCSRSASGSSTRSSSSRGAPGLDRRRDRRVVPAARTTTWPTRRRRRTTARSTTALEENAEQVLGEIDAALKRIDDGHVRHVRGVRAADRRGAARGAAVGDALHRRQRRGSTGERAGPAPTSASAPRPTRSTPVSVARRALAREREPVGRARGRRGRRVRRRPGHEAHRDEPARARRRRCTCSARSRSTTSRTRASRSGCSASATRDRDLLTGVAVAWMLVFFARSGARHPVLPGRARPPDRRQRLEPRRPGAARARHRLPRPRLLAGVQPRRQLHRHRRRAARLALFAAEPRPPPRARRAPSARLDAP